MRAALLSLLMVVLVWPAFRVSAEPRTQPSDTAAAMAATEIADSLLSRDPADYDRGMVELQAAQGKVCEALGKEILSRGVREAESLLASVAVSRSPNALVAAIVALESDTREVRNAAVDALLDAPFSVAARCGDEFLTPKRRSKLLEMLTAPRELALRCEALRRSAGGEIIESPQVAMNLSLLADRFFGARGFAGTLRGLALVMLGSDIPFPVEIAPPGPPRPGESQQEVARRMAQFEAAERERAAKLEIFLQELRSRQAAQAMFCAIWVADLTQFNYLADAGYRSREVAVQRIHKTLDAMEKRRVDLGEQQYNGLRCGDYLMELWSADVNDVKAAAYLRMRVMAGESVALYGEAYPAAVAEHNSLNRRQLAELRKNLKAWWTKYRAETEPR